MTAFRSLRISLCMAVLLAVGFGSPVSAADIEDAQYLMEGQVDYHNTDVNKQTAAFTGERGAGYGRVRDPRDAIAQMIQSLLVALGTLFFVYTVYAGYLILTSAGNEERVEKGKSILKNTIIGLAIILAAYSTTWLVRWMFVASGDDTYEKCRPPVYDDRGSDSISPSYDQDLPIDC